MTPCPVCAAPDARTFLSYEGHELGECRDCGLVFLDPMPAAEALAALYHDAYDGAQAGYFGKVGAKMRRSRRRLRWLARRLERPVGARSRLLDVGANGGFLVEAARELGFEAVGVELDPVSVDYAARHFAGSRFVRGTVEDLAAAGEPTFDAVYCSEVIEHVPDPNGFISGIVALMRPGALLYLTTPDIGHWRRPRDIRRWDGFSPPAHCLYFTVRSLARLLARHPLETVHRRFAWKPGIKILARRT